MSASRRDEIRRLRDLVDESDDLPALEKALADLDAIATELDARLTSEKDPDVRVLLEDLRGEAEFARGEAKGKVSQVKVDMLDAGWAHKKEQRAGERAAAEAQAAALKARFETEGLGGLMKGLSDLLKSASGAAKAAGLGSVAEAVAQSVCEKCGKPTPIAAKFCPDCGAPQSSKRACASCKAPLAANAKFCSQCGATATSTR